jgi:hypothetical protein
MLKIFISYRRVDTAETVNRLYDRLVYAFGRDNVFKDVDTLQRGDDFPYVLRDWVTTCDVFLSVIGTRWLEAQDEAGRRRLDNPNDWVRQETEMALARGKACMLIPTIVDGASFPKSEHLPESLVSLTNRNSQPVNPQHFHEDVGDLITFLRHQFGLVPPKPAINYDKAFRDLVDMITINEIEAARDILAAMRGQGNIPTRIRLDAVEQSLYRKVQLRERDLAYNSIQPLADLADNDLLSSSEVIDALDAFWQSFPEFANYDPSDFGRFRQGVPIAGISINGLFDSIEFTESAYVGEIPDISGFNLEVLKILPPPFEWCFVRGGKVIIDTIPSQIYTIPDFVISKYTITNAQYQIFLDAPDGFMYETEHGWYDFFDKAREYRMQNPAPAITAYQGNNLPRTKINWYDCVAFSRWLAHKTSFIISLPTEQQWQRAAIGDTGWKYPWGNKYDSKRCNTDESGIKRPVAVTSYPEGVSPFGAFNLSGNVWEWCLTDYSNPELSDISTDAEYRVLRGGSFSYFHLSAAASYRDALNPTIGDDHFGLRVVISPLNF